MYSHEVVLKQGTFLSNIIVQNHRAARYKAETFVSLIRTRRTTNPKFRYKEVILALNKKIVNDRPALKLKERVYINFVVYFFVSELKVRLDSPQDPI